MAKEPVKFNQKIVLDYIKSNNLTKKEFCKRCEITYYSLAKFLNNSRNLNIRVIIKICKLLDVEILDLWLNR